ncbi:MAG: hypothetical protein ACI9MF_002430 [Gammaproteobacteria bacterium]|jgi:hypothetical protein
MTEPHSMARSGASSLVDLERYPIDNIIDDTGKRFAEKCRREYLETGLCMLPGFIRQSSLSSLASESEAMREDAFFCKSSHNAYLAEDDSTLADTDVANRQEQTFVGSVPYDKIPSDSKLNQLYMWDPLKDFIGYVLGKKPFYRFADPFGACSINVFVDGGEHGWHFDESEFTVTLMLQKPDVGGTFEYVSCIRDLPEEKEIVEEVLNGKRDKVVELPFTAGTLLIFGGRQTLHRVSRVSGDRARLVPVLCYSEQPDVVNSESVRKLFWGRTGPDEQISAGQAI